MKRKLLVGAVTFALVFLGCCIVCFGFLGEEPSALKISAIGLFFAIIAGIITRSTAKPVSENTGEKGGCA